MKLSASQRAVIALKYTEGIGVMKANRLLSGIPEAAMLYEEIESIEQEIVWHIGHKLYDALRETVQKYDFDGLEMRLDEANAGIVCVCDADYPFLLKQFEDNPLMLYYKGDIGLLNSVSLAVVGTRYPSKYGIRVTEDFVSELCRYFTIVSGLASGVDAIAHRVTLKNGGKTVAVLGCGVDKVYPPENLQLYKEVAEKGLIVSEYALGELPIAYNFPARNRIITGLSRGVLVTEAGEKSGTMITVNHALDQGREVFVVPGSIYNRLSAGCNKLLEKSHGGAVTDVRSIFESLGLKYNKDEKPCGMKLDITEELIVQLLDKEGEMHFEEILENVDLTVPKLNSLLIKMQARGIISKGDNNYWSK